jgi:hypothetical protein
MLFVKAVAKGDLRTARLVQRDLTELLGLTAPQRLQVSSPQLPRSGMTNEELADLFNQLVETQAERLGTDDPARAGEVGESAGDPQWP